MDGGRLQFFDRAEPQRNEDDTFWREMKVGCLWSMTSQVSAEDPCPQLPASFVDPERMRRMVREIKGFSGPDASGRRTRRRSHASTNAPGVPNRWPAASSPRVTSVETFGKLLASEAYQRRFAAAPRKAFVADGSDANWGVWRRHFSDYVPILDFIHALTYVYAAAMAGQALKEGWQAYRHGRSGSGAGKSIASSPHSNSDSKSWANPPRRLPRQLPPRSSPRRWDTYGTSGRGWITPNTASKDCR